MPDHMCPHCGWGLPAGIDVCAACSEAAVNPYASPIAPREMPARRVPGKALLVRVVAVFCVALVVGIVLPGLGIAIGIIATPIWVRAAVSIQRQREAGMRLVPGDWTSAIFASFGVTLAVWVAATAAFVTVCFPIGLFIRSRNSGVVVAFVLGGAAGLAVWGFLFRRFWPKPVKKPAPTDSHL